MAFVSNNCNPKGMTLICSDYSRVFLGQCNTLIQISPILFNIFNSGVSHPELILENFIPTTVHQLTGVYQSIDDQTPRSVSTAMSNWKDFFDLMVFLRVGPSVYYDWFAGPYELVKCSPCTLDTKGVADILFNLMRINMGNLAREVALSLNLPDSVFNNITARQFRRWLRRHYYMVHKLYYKYRVGENCDCLNCQHLHLLVNSKSNMWSDSGWTFPQGTYQRPQSSVTWPHREFNQPSNGHPG
jgi:hypothetical protein